MPLTSDDARKKVHVTLWIIQGLLTVIYLFTGVTKLVLPLAMLKGPIALPGWFLRFLGAAEVVGAIGLILPGLLGIRPGLTPLAAACLVIIMIGATTLTLVGGPVGLAWIPFLVGVLAAAVAYGRWRVAPLAGRHRNG
jgi:DoxX-like family